jgi:predicted amidophosphoribosyltransferase
MPITCPNCGAELPEDAVFCDQCGASLGSSGAPAVTPAPAAAAVPMAESVCPQCGAPTIPGEAFCDNCGASLSEPAVAMPAPVQAVEEEPAVPAAPAAGVPALIQCPSCGADNLPGSTFCSNCGIRITEAEMEPAPVAAAAEETAVSEPEVAVAAEEEPAAEREIPPSTGVRRFIVRDTGAEIVLPSADGEYIIGREDPISGVFPEIDMNPYQGEHFGVSRRHAKLIIDAGLAFIEDLDSTNFTFVDRKKLPPRTPTALSSGDDVRLGKLVLTYLE